MRHDRTISILFIQLYSGTSFSAEIICKTIRHVMQSSFRKNGVISSCKVQKYRHSLTWLQRRFRVNRFCSRSHARSNFPFCFFHIYFAFQFKLWKTLNESHYHVLIRGKTIKPSCTFTLPKCWMNCDCEMKRIASHRIASSAAESETWGSSMRITFFNAAANFSSLHLLTFTLLLPS